MSGYPDAPPRLSRWRSPWLTWLVTIFVVGVAAAVLTRNADDFRALVANASPEPLLAAVAVGMVGQFLNAWIARISLAQEGDDVDLRSVYRILAVGGVAKYVPGGVWQVATQAGMGHAHGLGIRASMLAWIEPTVFNVTLGGGIAFLLATTVGYQVPALLLAAAGVALIALSTDPLRRRLYRLVRLAAPQPPTPTPSAWTRRAALTGVIVVTTGLGGMLVASAFPVGAHPDLLASSAVFTGAWAIGLLAFPVPGGLGVREGALVVALSPWMPAHQAVVVAGAARLTAVVGELLSALVASTLPHKPVGDPARPFDIAYVGPLPPTRGGVSQHGAMLVQALTEAGRTVTPVSWRSPYPKLLYPGETEHLPPSSTHFMRWWSPASWLAGRRIAAGSRMVLFPWITPFHALPLRVVLKGLKATRIALVHNALPHESFPMARPLTRWGLRDADTLTAFSHSVAKEIEDLTDRSVTILPNAPSLVTSPQPVRRATPAKLLFLGYVRPYKGLDVLLEAMTRLDDGVRLTVAGEAWEDAHGYRVMAGELGVLDRIDFRFGYVPDDEVTQLLASHDLVVQPYRSASQSGIVPVAFAAGRPVVVTPVGGLAEQVRDGENGVIARSSEPGDLAEAIRSALDRVEVLSAGALRSAPAWETVTATIETLERATRSQKGLD